MATPTITPTPAAAPTPTPQPTPTPAAPATEPTTAQLREAAVAASAPQPAPAAEHTTAPETAPETAPAAPAPAPAPAYTIGTTADGQTEIKLATGAVYRGANLEEAVGNLAAGKVEADRTIRQMRNPATPASQPTPTVPTATPAPAVEVSAEQAEARQWMVREFAAAIGMTPEQLMTALPQAIQTSQDVQQQNLAASFMQRCPDFPNTPEASDALVELAGQLGLPPTAEGLEAAHLMALRRGLYQPVAAPAAQTPRPTPPPMLSSSAPAPSTGAPTDADLRSMPMDQLRALAQQRVR